LRKRLSQEEAHCFSPMSPSGTIEALLSNNIAKVKSQFSCILNLSY